MQQHEEVTPSFFMLCPPMICAQFRADMIYVCCDVLCGIAELLRFAHAAIEMVPKKTVEQSVDMEGQSRECPVRCQALAFIWSRQF